MLVDTASGSSRPADNALMAPLSPEQIALLPRYTPEQMARRVVKAGDRDWSSSALLSAGLPGYATELAPVIGHGMTEDRAHAAPIGNPHGFSIEWLRMAPGNATGRHLLDEKQVVIVFSGALDVTLNGPAAKVPVHIATGECFSAPASAWRNLAAAGDTHVEAALITAGDARKRITWAPEIVRAAMDAGMVLDHDGHVAPLALLPPPRAPPSWPACCKPRSDRRAVMTYDVVVIGLGASSAELRRISVPGRRSRRAGLLGASSRCNSMPTEAVAISSML